MQDRRDRLDENAPDFIAQGRLAERVKVASSKHMASVRTINCE